MKNLKKKLLSTGLVLCVTLGISSQAFASYTSSPYYVYGNGGSWQAALSLSSGKGWAGTYANSGTSIHVFARCTSINGTNLMDMGTLGATTGQVGGSSFNGYHTVTDVNGVVHIAVPADGQMWNR